MSSSSLNSIYGLNRMRITGMNSGLDTDSIISQLMKVEQMKVDKQFKAMTQKEWKRDQIRDVNKQIQDFRNEFMSMANSTKNILSSLNYKGYKVTSDDTKNRATITASSGAMAGTHTLDAVTKLATGDKMTSGEVVDGGNAISSTGKTLGELQNEGSLAGLGLYTGAVDEEGYALNADGVRLIDQEGGIGDVTGVNADGTAVTSGKLIINDTEIEYNVNDTLSSFMNRVNASEAGVTMGYSQLTDRFTFTSKKTGVGSELTIGEPGDSNMMKALGFDKPGAKVEEGHNAEAYIDGIRVERETNNFSIDGINYSLKKTFNEDLKGEGIGFEVAQDVDKAVDMIKEFVAGYNKLVSSLTAMVGEKPNSDYLPLTDEERDTLSESQITKWDTESKKGLLYNDSNIKSLLNDMRSQFFTEIEGAGLSMAEIGIAPGSSVVDDVYIGTQSDIQIDEEKLRKALEENPDRVAQMFMGGSALKESKMSEAGIGNRLIKLMNNYKNTTSDIQTASLDYEIDNLDDKIESMKDRMSAQEELLYKKYAAMETALSKMQSQTSSLLSQLG